MGKKSCLKLSDWSRADLDRTLDRAISIKKDFRKGRETQLLKGQVLGMIFHKPSLRTRLSFEVAMWQLGGKGMLITDAEIGFGRREAVKDIGAVMSRYLDGIMIRTFHQKDIEDLDRASTIPIINGLTNEFHPCQILSDMLTLREKGLSIDGLSLAYLGDSNNIVRSWLNAGLRYKLDLRIGSPKGFEPEEELVEAVQHRGVSKVLVTSSPQEAVAGAHVIYTDTWTSMGQENEAEERRKIFPPFQVNSEMLKGADPDVLVMHCLPAHRGEEITDEVMDGPHSIVYDQAENRLHAQKGLLVTCMEG
ncbi:MAG: ornithine carbamoyltransferase [Candidatus Eisenbacteria bacterium]|uniref:Ornithine carbamoyltransferase n=1 Tax=Eiseniibacteriota bacterium TaxID=2212470 RepID=A0A948RVG0_UNCEI|nr:ornithine carbamoyltransferase [Candidatus Eisenbacteria bacterium]MBU1947595.1 ornithine carbamoyltransferase [Candidatus Eisenbacteria bacterium]MBU2690298.1 ornithine carbamoyltransferase [Candidatus Eisenbacteria bacterium]